MNDDYNTPSWIMEIFGDWFDPCSISIGKLREFDGLGDWKHKTFVNPPYSSPLKWVEKSIEENKKGKTVVMLLRVDTSTKWYAKLIEAKAEILWFSKRLRFNDGKTSANFPSMLVVLDGNLKKRTEILIKEGKQKQL